MVYDLNFARSLETCTLNVRECTIGFVLSIFLYQVSTWDSSPIPLGFTHCKSWFMVLNFAKRCATLIAVHVVQDLFLDLMPQPCSRA